MHKKISIIGLAIAVILTAYISPLVMSNQAFAQHNSPNGEGSGGLVGFLPGNELSGTDGSNTWAAQLGQILGGIHTTIHHILKGGTTTGLGCGNSNAENLNGADLQAC
jgi:hypothetical protein